MWTVSGEARHYLGEDDRGRGGGGIKKEAREEEEMGF